MELRQLSVGVVGLGLLGASLAWRLDRTRGARRVIGWDRDPRVRETARRRRILREVPERLEDLLPETDLLIFAVPRESAEELDRRISRILGETETPAESAPGERTRNRPRAMVDLSGGTAVEAIRRRWGNRGIGLHFMVTAERMGIENATPLLFEKVPCAVIPYPETSPEVAALAEELAQAVEAEAVRISFEEHQTLNALVDHLPRLTAAALVLAAEGEQRNHPAFSRLARAAFRDTTRPAAYPPQGLGFEMTETGDNHLRQLTERFITAMGEMLRLPAWALEARLERAAAAREDLLESPRGETAAA